MNPTNTSDKAEYELNIRLLSFALDAKKRGRTKPAMECAAIKPFNSRWAEMTCLQMKAPRLRDPLHGKKHLTQSFFFI
jgi:hypothetical protein